MIYQAYRVIIRVVIPLIVGVCIYSQFRGYLIFGISDNLINWCIPNWIKYNLPDGLWLFSFLEALAIVWGRNHNRTRLLWILTAFLLSLLSEFMQDMNLLAGTFDKGDIIAYLIAISLFFVINEQSTIVTYLLNLKVMKTKKNIFSALVVTLFIALFWASSTPEKLSKTYSTYEEVVKKESTPITISYELPVITPTKETRQTQTKGGVTITCEVIPHELSIEDVVRKEVFYADPNKPGYDIYEVSHTPKAVAKPDDFELNIKIKNNQERILKVRETALLLQIDGITVHIPEASLTDWYAGMIIKNGEFNYRIKVPEFNSLLNAKLVYLFINDVPTIMDEGGNIKKRENFEWYFECTKKRVTQQAQKTYTYETKLIESKRCDKCQGTGTDPQAYKCSKCKGAGTTVNIFDGKTYKCSTCDGTGIVYYKCPDCSGKGTLYFPKSPHPRLKENVVWTGHGLSIKSKPDGATVKMINPETGKYEVKQDYGSHHYSWYCTSGKSCPILIDFNGKEVKVLPYDSKGKESKSILVDFTKPTPQITGGTITE